MKLGQAFEVAIRTYLTKARAIIPFYFFIPSAAAIARVVPFLGVVIAVALLQRSGALAEIREELVAGDPIVLYELNEQGQQEDPFAEPGTGPQPDFADGIGDILAGEPLAVGVVVAAILSMYVVGPAVLWGSAAGRLHGIKSALTDPTGTAARYYFDNDQPSGGSGPPTAISGRSAGIDTPRGPVDRRPSRTPKGPIDRQPMGTDTPSSPTDRDPPGERTEPGTGRPPGSNQQADSIASGIQSEDVTPPKSPIMPPDGNRPLRAAVDGIFTHWWTFVALFAVETVVLVATFLPFLLFAALGAAGALFGVLYFLAWMLVIVPIVRLFFAFAKPAAVVDETGVGGALSGAAAFVKSHPGQTFAYGLLSLVALGGVVVVGVIASALDAGALAGVTAYLLVFPLLDTFKTLLYADDADDVIVYMPHSAEQPIHRRLKAELGTGLGSLKSFTTGHPAIVGANAALFVLAIYLAWRFTAGIDGAIQASIEERAAGNFPPGMMVNYFANNWGVGIAQSFSGVALGVPSIVSILFNGLMIGAFLRFEVALVPFLAFIIPHGLIELPALVLSGALGLYLGVVVFRYAAGGIDREGLTDEIEHAYEVTMGLAVLFALAAIIEGFFSPYYWRLLGL